MDTQTPKAAQLHMVGGPSEAFFNYIKTPDMTHRGPQTATPEKDEIIHPHFGNTHMHVHARVQKKAGGDTNLKIQRLHTYTPTANRDRK